MSVIFGEHDIHGRAGVSRALGFNDRPYLRLFAISEVKTRTEHIVALVALYNLLVEDEEKEMQASVGQGVVVTLDMGMEEVGSQGDGDGKAVLLCHSCNVNERAVLNCLLSGIDRDDVSVHDVLLSWLLEWL